MGGGAGAWPESHAPRYRVGAPSTPDDGVGVTAGGAGDTGYLPAAVAAHAAAGRFAKPDDLAVVVEPGRDAQRVARQGAEVSDLAVLPLDGVDGRATHGATKPDDQSMVVDRVGVGEGVARQGGELRHL